MIHRFKVTQPRGGALLDLAYVAMTAAFFAAMIAYTRACASLGRGSGESKDER